MNKPFRTTKQRIRDVIETMRHSGRKISHICRSANMNYPEAMKIIDPLIAKGYIHKYRKTEHMFKGQMELYELTYDGREHFFG
ncbi:MAG: hypothetical protein KKF54_07325 [Candidatus Omnitrophica bacterium]|nr:hypothetical protein [Candidatus Omnitrophota bacterium]